MRKRKWKPRKRKCQGKADGCLGDYMPRESFQKTCDNIPCAIKVMEADKKKAAEKKAKADRAKTRQEKEEAKTRGKLLADAQEWFNRFIVLRDWEDPCISCGRYHDVVKWNAGHFQSVGARADLRFNEDNCHKQCARPCNKDLSGNVIEYRKGLLRKIGRNKVLILEGPPGKANWTRDEIRAIKRLYRRKAQALKKSLDVHG
jgi:hypothetical protein